MYSNDTMVGAGQPYHTGNEVVGSSAMPNVYGMPPGTTPTPTTVAPAAFSSCAPVTHHQERAALQQQLQELYCMPPAPENQEKIVNLQEKLQALQQHETNEQCNGGPQCILQTPMFTAAAAAAATTVPAPAPAPVTPAVAVPATATATTTAPATVVDSPQVSCTFFFFKVIFIHSIFIFTNSYKLNFP